MDNEIISKCGYRCDLCLAFGPNVVADDRRQILSDGWYMLYGFRIEAEDIVCEGCQSSGKPLLIDKGCPVRPCVVEREIDNCSSCPEFICHKLKERIVDRSEIEKNLGRRVTSEEYELFIKPYETRERLELLRKGATKSD